MAIRDPLGNISVSPWDRDSYERGLRRFLREARNLASLDHPHIVRATDYFVENSTAYLVMDYMASRGLRQVLKESGGKLPRRRVEQIGQQLV